VPLQFTQLCCLARSLVLLPLVQSHSTVFATVLAVVMVLAVVALVAWALQLMQAASDSREFSLMLAGCMVCSAAVGLATVMVMTFTSVDRVESQLAAGGVSLDAISIPWDASFDSPR
jgi:ABC-type glycerol-3-phosphate transport system permease component